MGTRGSRRRGRRAEVLALEGVALQRGPRRILHRVNWEVQAGEHWAILGANGSGKTTLLRVVMGYEWPTDGRVRVLGRVFGETELAELRKHVGWVSSSLEQRVHPDDTALEVVVSGLEAALSVYRVYSDNEWRLAQRALELVNVGELADQSYGTLSQGERQRVLVARALVGRPGLLILDEACAGLDPVAREALLSDLGELAQDPDAPTLLVVTHHLEEIGPWITHVLLLARGEVLAAGPLRETLTSHNLSQAFGRPCELHWQDGRCRLRLVEGA
ncbi:ABC transporter ATP-binding protein [bacterium]|nr:ABC transporter ATP-binding protein [bacterium]